jgi:Tol biopolymer transport system component
VRGRGSSYCLARMNRFWISAGALGVMLVAVCASSAAGSSLAAPPSQIVFAANRSPLVNGEIYRVDPDGSRIDLSKSPGLDLFPAVSPNGKRAAFLSVRGGHAAVYVVGTDGRGLKRLSPPLFVSAPNNGLSAQFAWTADSRSFAATVSGSDPGQGGLYVWVASGWRVLVRHLTNMLGAPSWSRDGSMLAYATSDATVHVVSPSGKRLWSVVGDGPPAWGKADRLAVSSNSTTIRVYDRSGHQVAAFPGKSFAWSPSGAVLAVMDGKRLQLRRGGVGRPFLDQRLAHSAVANTTFNYGISWVGNSRLLLFGDNGWIGYDVAHKQLWPLPAAVANDNGIFLPGGAIAYWDNQPGGVAQLKLQLPGAASARVLTTAIICGDEYPSWLQVVPHTQSLVYQSACSNPSADLYDVNPDGSGLRQLTDTSTDERQPSVSPDGSSVVYVQQQFAEKCDGCAQTLWRVPTVGGTPEQLTSHTDQDETPFDMNPSWSPDGQQIAFLRGGTNTPLTLFVMPASGGAARNLRVEGYEPVWGPRRIAYVSNTVKPTVKTLDPASGATQTVAKGDYPGGPLAWSRDGRLAYLQDDGEGHSSIVIVGSLAKPIALAPLLTPGAEVQGLAWSPDGTRFAFTATDANGIGEVYTIGVNGKNLTQVTHDISAVGNLSWR